MSLLQAMKEQEEKRRAQESKIQRPTTYSEYMALTQEQKEALAHQEQTTVNALEGHYFELLKELEGTATREEQNKSWETMGRQGWK